MVRTIWHVALQENYNIYILHPTFYIFANVWKKLAEHVRYHYKNYM